MARRYRLEYLQQRKRKEIEKQKRLEHAQAEEKQEEEELTREEKVVNSLYSALGWVVYVIIIIAATYLLVTYVGQRTKVSGNSMEPSLHNGDNLIVDKITYRFRDPKRYEIIVFPYRYEEGTFYIKRIIGLPGETVQILDGEVYINGKVLEKDYGIEPIERGKEGMAGTKITLKEDQYFVMGDNRNHSSDSRSASVGLLNRREIMGRAWVRIWPLNNIGVVSHD